MNSQNAIQFAITINILRLYIVFAIIILYDIKRTMINHFSQHSDNIFKSLYPQLRCFLS
jgi:hypothetical protein